MLINAAPRSYTSNIVADADLNLEGYNVTANALYSKDNYLLTMLDYGEAFPTDVKEGDKLFAWGEDSTKSYIYTYKQGAWDAGVKPQHMQDYYIADENRTVKFCLYVPSDSLCILAQDAVNSTNPYTYGRPYGVVFGPDVYILGSFYLFYGNGSASGVTTTYVEILKVYFTNGTSSPVGTCGIVNGTRVVLGGDNPYFVGQNVVISSKCNSFNIYFIGGLDSGSGRELTLKLGYQFDV